MILADIRPGDHVKWRRRRPGLGQQILRGTVLAVRTGTSNLVEVEIDAIDGEEGRHGSTVLSPRSLELVQRHWEARS